MMEYCDSEEYALTYLYLKSRAPQYSAYKNKHDSRVFNNMCYYRKKSPKIYILDVLSRLNT